MKKIYIYLTLLVFSSNIYAIDIGIYYSNKASNIIAKNTQDIINSEITRSLVNYSDDIKLSKISDKSFAMNLLKKNKQFLKEYSISNKLGAIVVLDYKRSVKNIHARLFLNDESNLEVINFAPVSKKTPKNNALSVSSAIMKSFVESNVIAIERKVY